MKHYRHFLMILLILGFFSFGQQVFGQYAKDKDPIVDQIAQKAKRSTVLLITAESVRQIKVDDGSPLTEERDGGGVGSGFFVDHDKIATNIHCVAGKTKIRAKLVGTETPYDIEGVIAWDPENDLVILKVAGKGPKPLSLGNSDAVRKGEPIAAVGTPEGGFEGQITHGKVYNRRGSDKWLRLTANLLPGNSGGPVLSSKGVIGVAAQGVISEYRPMSYAIPSNTLKQLLKNSKSAQPLDLEEWQQKKTILAYDYDSLAQNMFMKGTGKSDPKDRHLFYKYAIKLLDKAIDRYQSPEFYLLRGRVYEELEEYQKAIDDYTECIDLKCDYATAYSNRGLINAKRRLYEKAITDYKEAIKLIPDDAFSYMLMGDSKLNLGRYEEAIADFGKAIKLSPNNADAYYGRGIARYNWGKFEEDRGRNAAARNQYQAAEKDLNRALELNPDEDVSDDASRTLKLVKEALKRLQ